SSVVILDESTQPNPDMIVPSAIRNRGPNLSTKNPCTGEEKVCRMITSEMVNWIAGRAAPVVVWNGLTNSVQTYCGLEIVIIAMKPNSNCSQRLDEIAGAS